MSNSILNNQQQHQQPQQLPQQPNMQMLQQFQQFRQMFRGDPKQTVMNMLNSGQISNPQLQQAMQYANQFKSMFK